MGMLIVIEGISGSGKSSFAKKLCKLLFKYGIPHSSYGGFNISEQSTELTKFCNYIVTHERFLGFPIISETHLLLAEIIMDIELNVKKELEDNKVVIYENYFDSVYIYQSARIKMMDIADNEKEILQRYLDQTIILMNDSIDIPIPKINVFLNSDLDICNKRLISRDNLAITDKHIRLQREIQKKYLKYYNGKNNFIINTNDKLELEIILNKLLSCVQNEGEMRK